MTETDVLTLFTNKPGPKRSDRTIVCSSSDSLTGHWSNTRKVEFYIYCVWHVCGDKWQVYMLEFELLYTAIFAAIFLFLSIGSNRKHWKWIGIYCEKFPAQSTNNQVMIILESKWNSKTISVHAEWEKECSIDSDSCSIWLSMVMHYFIRWRIQ